MAKRKYLKSTKPIRFWWKQGVLNSSINYNGHLRDDGVLFYNLMADFGEYNRATCRVYTIGTDEPWYQWLDNRAFPTAKAARAYVEEQLGLVVDND